MPSVSSLNFNPLMVRYSLALPHRLKMVLNWTLMLMVIGVVDWNVLFLMCESFNPHAPSDRHPRCYRRHELEKKCHYEQ